jgi:DNA repair protein RecO (recombination protein O)
MAIPRSYKTEAIILRGGNLNEADRILTLYTPNLGKVKAIAKGVRRPTAKLSGHLELLTHCTLMLTQGRNLDIITQAQIVESFSALRHNLKRLSQSFYFVELTDAFTPERVENWHVFVLLLETLRWLSRKDHLELVPRYFELNLLSDVGYRPELYKCLNCQSSLRSSINFFSAHAGGVLCPNCASTEQDAQRISLNALKTMRFLQNNNLAIATRLRTTSEISKEVENIIHNYIRHLLEQEPKSVKFLNQVKQGAASKFRGLPLLPQ